MSVIPNSLEELIEQFSKLPGIGRKTAERLSIYILKTSKDEVYDFSDKLKNLKESIKTCDICHCFIEDDLCSICNQNEKSIICIIANPTDVFLINKSGYSGMYHVLGGLISPLDGVRPENLNFNTLLNRLDNVEEIIIAFNPSSEGDMTNLYLTELLKSYNIKLSKIATGIPVGTSLEFIDQVTLTHSINDRVKIK